MPTMEDRIGTTGSDTLRGSDSQAQRLMGMAGNDLLIIGEGGGGAFGGNGDDVIHGGGLGRAQSHIYGGNGNDTIHLHPESASAPHGEHVWGGEGRDSFIFHDIAAGSGRVVGRLDDFDYTRDELWIDDELVDLRNPPDGVRIVGLNCQPWILIDDRILYALEGARIIPEGGQSNGEETHFIDWPAEWQNGVPASADIAFEDFENFFPADRAVAPPGGFREILGGGEKAARLARRGAGHPSDRPRPHPRLLAPGPRHGAPCPGGWG